VIEPFTLPFFQRGVVEVLLLAVLAGYLGTWIVLRGMAFFAHAAGSAAFPGLVLAEGLGFAAPLGALGAVLVAALLVAPAGRRSDSVTALVLAGAMALGVLLASDVFESSASVDRMLFGSLLSIDAADLALALAAGAAALAASAVAGPRWLAAGFTAADGFRWADALLVVLVALAVVATLAATGALLATALLVVPAATTRLLADRIGPWQRATVALAAGEGVLGLWLAYQLDVPPGAAVAVLAGAVFALAACATAPALRRRAAPALALALWAAALSGCAGEGGHSGRVRVVATTPQVADIVRQVGGSSVDVEQLLDPAVEPHDFEPRPRDVAAVADADLVFSSGLGLDEWLAELTGDSGSDVDPIELAGGLPVLRAGDPHWWHDPRNVAAAATAVEQALVASAPERERSAIAARAREYRAQALDLDAAIRECLARLAPDERALVTDHDAFTYFTLRYGLRHAGAVFPATSGFAQPSAGDLAELERTIEEQGVRAVFPESALEPRLARRLAEDTGVAVGRALRGDTLGDAGTPESTVLGTLAANAGAIAEGLSGGRERCEAPR
jgi:manganese/iron transport system permease protein